MRGQHAELPLAHLQHEGVVIEVVGGVVLSAAEGQAEHRAEVQSKKENDEDRRCAKTAAPGKEARRRQPDERHQRQEQQRKRAETFANTERRFRAEAVERRRAHGDLRQREEGIENMFIDQLRRIKHGQKCGQHKGDHRAAAPAHAAKQRKKRRRRTGEGKQPDRGQRIAERRRTDDALTPQDRDEKIQKASERRFLKESHKGHHLIFHYISRCAICQLQHILKTASCGTVTAMQRYISLLFAVPFYPSLPRWGELCETHSSPHRGSQSDERMAVYEH